ncbi:unnamed protein product [Mesocestoides corti]|uniref:Guanylate kinase/L-type calcium channel beta subunit domain-containing protein n=1 Tax=Mesocestoides corti TaxID=53468 RepID=A0A158QT27_MESCO|nr:unnamed protein product [Mesocestoides corti]
MDEEDYSESSGESSDEDELLLRAELREQEHRALIELEIAENAPVAFCVRTNVEFDGLLNGLDAPIPTKVVSFCAKEFLQIKRRFDQNWWIGRVVREDASFGFLPSTSKLEALRHSMQANLSQLLLSEALTAAASNGPGNTMGGTSAFASGKVTGLGVSLPDMESEKTPTQAVSNLTTTLPSASKKKTFFRKGFTGPPYELVPNVRPVVVVGPALKGYEVTDMMQKALFDSLKKSFEERIVVTRVTSDISAWKRLSVLINMDKKALKDRTRGRQIITALEVQREIERIFDLATNMQLVVIDSDTINHPHQIAKSCLAPIMVYIKISSIRVLQRLIKNRGKSQKKQTNSQIAAAEKLLQCAEESFDVVLEQNNLEGATEALSNYLESYLKAIHYNGDKAKAERQPPPHFNLRPNESRAVPPMIPGRPGLNIAFSVAGSAGFQLQEMSVLAGDRHAGHTGTEGGGVGEDGAEEGKEKKDDDHEEGGGDVCDGEEHKEAVGHATEKTDKTTKSEMVSTTKMSDLPTKGHKADGKKEGGILKRGPGKKSKHTLANIIPDRAHAIALAEAVVKNANAAAAAATRLDVPDGATIGLHQSRQAAHIYASRSSRQAKQRQEELEAARKQSEEAARAAAEARAASGAQRQEKRRRQRLLAEQVAANHAGVKFGEARSHGGDRGPVLGRSLRGHMPPDDESQSAPGSNLRRNTSSVATTTSSGRVARLNQPIPLIIHPTSET